jgi:bifunctional ADP-heptose synthase (sugar kinase/adenylyltransferase)
MLTTSRLEQILARIPGLTVGVVGDLFLDRYLDLDARLREPSLETGLGAYQVVRVRSQPGAAGTVINNLVALGVGRVCLVTVIGDDGEAFELGRCLEDLGRVDTRWVVRDPGRRTPTYTKPMLCQPDGTSRELNRLDIKNRTLLAERPEKLLLEALDQVWPQVDALVVLDQVSEADCGVVTTRLRERLAELGAASPDKLILADSRERIGLFRSICLKPNLRECHQAVYGKPGVLPLNITDPVWELAARVGRSVFCTVEERGMIVAEQRLDGSTAFHAVRAYPVHGPIDTVGAGDSTSAAIVCAIASGATAKEAAAFGNLVASITIQQIGTTGTATPEQVRQRWHQVSGETPG